MADIRELTLAYAAAFNNKDAPAAANFFADNGRLTDPSTDLEGKVLFGLGDGGEHNLSTFLPQDKIQEFVAGIFKANPDVAFTVRTLVVDGNNSVIEFKLKLGDKNLQGSDFIEWEGGKIKALRAYLY
eukprot:NODE_4327_length_814_cov_2.628758_g3584_i0.p2 GENE.NODE_4327_length_814_cov_2.628758_g3584_i0~~NODE_4327_length_814_cov_2.628758_g3584_i0.p2  ORF type:complete len:128 (-),score=36.87 NODE_4327_length_814_cov_2.628758_g3584_i0:29-412(-)